MTRLTVNGLEFHLTEQGQGAPLVLLHGFTGSAAAWGGCLPALAERFRIIAVDLVGHGETAAPAALDHYRMPAVVADLAALLDALQLPSVALLGYSMGGRTALHFAAAYPERVAALLLESASPGLADPAERAARVASDEAMADRIEHVGLEAFVAEWEQLPLFRSQERLPAAVRAAHHAQRLHNRPHGLANSLRGMGAGAQEPLWDTLQTLTMPVFLLTGSDDAKYGATAAAMAARLARATSVVVPEAGHTVHLEQPGVFVGAVMRFLDGVGDGRALTSPSGPLSRAAGEGLPPEGQRPNTGRASRAPTPPNPPRRRGGRGYGRSAGDTRAQVRRLPPGDRVFQPILLRAPSPERGGVEGVRCSAISPPKDAPRPPRGRGVAKPG